MVFLHLFSKIFILERMYGNLYGRVYIAKNGKYLCLDAALSLLLLPKGTRVVGERSCIS